MTQLIPLPLTVSCFSKIQIGSIFLVPTHPGSPGKRAIKRVCVFTFVGSTKHCSTFHGRYCMLQYFVYHWLSQSGSRQQLLVPGWPTVQSLDRSQHSRRQLVTDVISQHDSSGSWLPRTSLLDQLQNAAAAAATRALVAVTYGLGKILFRAWLQSGCGLTEKTGLRKSSSMPYPLPWKERGMEQE